MSRAAIGVFGIVAGFVMLLQLPPALDGFGVLSAWACLFVMAAGGVFLTDAILDRGDQ